MNYGRIRQRQDCFSIISIKIQYSGLDEATGEKDYVMVWQQK